MAGGAFLWKKTWGVLQAGPLWGYLPIPVFTPSASDSARDGEVAGVGVGDGDRKSESVNNANNNAKSVDADKEGLSGGMDGWVTRGRIADSGGAGSGSGSGRGSANSSRRGSGNMIKDREKDKDKEKGVVKRWSLAPAEGPERLRIRMQQEYGPSLALKVKDKVIGTVWKKEKVEEVEEEEIMKTEEVVMVSSRGGNETILDGW